jgi:uncharacterized DUF497 family protein
MIKVKDFVWDFYEKAKDLSKGVSHFKREDIEEAILGHGTRVKEVSNNKYIVLGKTDKREYLFSVVYYLKKFTLFPMYVREMNPKEKEHYEEFQHYPY